MDATAPSAEEIEKLVTELEIARRELVEARRRCRRLQRDKEVAERIRTEFLVNMSHELRTPMTAILGFVRQLTEDPAAPAEARDLCLRSIESNAAILMNLVGDVFDLSQLRTGELVVENTETALRPLLSEITDEAREAAGAKDIGFDVTFLGALPSRIQTDGERLRRLLRNLVQAAITHTSQGGVRLMVGLDVGAEATRLRFTVADSGRGLSPDELASIVHLVAPGGSSLGGTAGRGGLGLSIATHLANVLGGEIRAESIEHHGSVFQLAIDPGTLTGEAFAELEAPTLGEDPSTRSVIAQVRTSGPSGTILYVDDSPDNRRLISLILERAGFAIECAEDGAQGIEAALAARALGRPYGVILMDLQMPVLDGYGATQKLRAANWSGPIVALTANVLDGERVRALDAGCDHFLTKPIARRELVTLISALLNAQ